MSSTPSTSKFHPTLILHGGAGNIQRSTLPPDLYQKYRTSLLTYLRSTTNCLENGWTALDATAYAVSLMEDDELFNCGRGSVFTSEGKIEMEASVMVSSVTEQDGEGQGMKKRGAGVMRVRNVKHPIQLAREVLLRTGDGKDGDGNVDGGDMHSQLCGEYVESCAKEWGLEFKPDSYFWTKRRWEEHLRGLKGDEEEITMSQGTVGCVCLDQYGGIAVATSTGGLTNKKPGRIGDTPTLGAGFWAESWVERVSGEQLRFAMSEEPVLGLRKTDEMSEDTPGILRGAWSMAKEALWRDCLPSLGPSQGYSSVPTNAVQYSSERPSLSDSPPPYTSSPSPYMSIPHNRRRAVAMSGTGNGDSFLRVAAVRTAAAMARFSSTPQTPVSLSSAVRAVAGPGGELQRSAGSRWGKTGEGEGGIIGIEVALPEASGKDESSTGSDISSMGGLRKGNVVFDFNCGGMFRAWLEDDPDHPGRERERMMVFRDEYV